MSANQAKIKYSVLYFGSIDELTSSSKNTNEGTSASTTSGLSASTASDYRDITSWVTQLNMFQHLFHPLEVVLNLEDYNAPALFNTNSRMAFYVTLEAASGTISRLMVADKISRVYNDKTASTTYQVSLKSVESGYSPKFSKVIKGSLQTIISEMYTTIYRIKNLSTYQPEINLADDNIFAPNLIQYQTLREYIEESKLYAVASDFSPYIIWEQFSGTYGKSLVEIIKQKPVPIIISSMDTVGYSAYSPIQANNGDIAYYGFDFRNEMVMDVQKNTRSNRIKYLNIQDDGNISSYTSTIDSVSTADYTEEVHEIIQGYDFDETLNSGVACIVRAHCKKLLETTASSFVLMTPFLTLEPGQMISINTANDNIGSKDYIVVKVETTESNKAGQQTIYALDIAPIKQYLETTGKSLFDFNSGFVKNDN